MIMFKFNVNAFAAAACFGLIATTGAHAFEFLGLNILPDLGQSQPIQQANLPSDPSRDVQPTRTVVNDPTGEKSGSITIDTKNRYLYLSLGEGKAMRYGIGVGREGFAWSGRAHVARRAEWPAWTPPAEMLKRRPDLPEHMEGGIANPLGARAMYLFNEKGDTMYRIHGTNEPDSIGQAVSSGCIRLLNADVIDLYDRVKVGAPVNVI
ncbi:L,D-transpeptidase family protein [Methyloferula stellata]|uniref:L,D-transpeptidase family protein n=1 Tax=Methyloferula stellata TaxID=876270 RepID=UPI000372E128